MLFTDIFFCEVPQTYRQSKNKCRFILGITLMLSCKKRTTTKYTSRNTPPYDANTCKVGTSRKGNNGFMYVVSSPNRNGMKRWMKKPASKTSKTARKTVRKTVRKPVRKTSKVSTAKSRAVQESRLRAKKWAEDRRAKTSTRASRPTRRTASSVADSRRRAAEWAKKNLPNHPSTPASSSSTSSGRSRPRANSI